MPLTEDKAFHVPFVMGMWAQGLYCSRCCGSSISNFKGAAIANRAENRIMAPEVAAPGTASHPIQFERTPRLPGGIALGSQLLIVLFRFFR